MTEREALAAAFDSDWTETGYSTPLTRWLAPILEAARERLAQLPEQCGTCNGSGQWQVDPGLAILKPCPTCHGSGKVYPAELVERIARAMRRADASKALDEDAFWQTLAVAVLDALNEG